MGRTKKPEDEKFNYKEWYEQHKGEISQKRREKYQQNQEHRESVIARARYHYWTKVRANKLVQGIEVEKVDVSTDKTIPVVIQNPDDARFGQTLQLVVVDSGELGTLMNRTPQTLRLWERRGITPPALWRDPRGYRLYTEDQVKAFLSCKHYLDMPMKKIEDSVFAREIKKALEAMPDGIEVAPVRTLTVSGECNRCHYFIEKKVKDYELAHVHCEKCGGSILPHTKFVRES